TSTGAMACNPGAGGNNVLAGPSQLLSKTTKLLIMKRATRAGASSHEQSSIPGAQMVLASGRRWSALVRAIVRRHHHRTRLQRLAATLRRSVGGRNQGYPQILAVWILIWPPTPHVSRLPGLPPRLRSSPRR